MPDPAPGPSQTASEFATPAGAGSTPPTLDPPPTAVGVTVPPTGWTLVSRLTDPRPHARGGLGEVFVATDEALGRPVAVKEIRPDHAADGPSRERFLREAEITGRLDHPGVVPVYALGHKEDGRPFYAMRFVQGRTLHEAIRELHEPAEGAGPAGRELAFRQLLTRFVAVCNAVAYAHSRGVIHRDLKPQNVMLGPFGEALVIDWGLARPFARSESQRVSGEETLRPASGGGVETQLGAAVGTPAYMSPEQAAGNWDVVGPASDVYALGATLYTLLTGRPPFGGEPWPALQQKIQRGEFVPPRQAAPATPPALDAVCRKAMALKPEDRYPTALALAGDLERWLADEPVSAYREPWGARARRWGRRHRTLVTATGMLLVAAVVGLSAGTVLLKRERDRTDEARQEADRNADAARRNLELAQVNEARALRQERRARDAVQTYFTAVSQDPELSDQGLAPLRRKLLESARRFTEEFLQENRGEVGLRHELAAAHLRLGSILQSAGGKAEALREHRSAVELLRAVLAERPGDLGVEADLGRALTLVGDVCFDTSRLSDAEAAFRESLAIAERQAAARPDDPGGRKEVALSLQLVGNALRIQGRGDKAAPLYVRCREMRQALVREFPDRASLKMDLAASLYTDGTVHLVEGRFAEGARSFQAAADLQRRVASGRRGVGHDHYVLAMSLTNLGVCELQRGRLKEAEAVATEALAIRRRLVDRYPDVNDYALDLSRSLNQLANIYKDTGRDAQAEENYQQLLAISQELARSDPTVSEYAIGVGSAEGNLGNLRLEKGDAAGSLEWFTRSAATLAAVVQREPNNSFARVPLMNAYANRAQALNHVGRAADAIADWDRALTLAPEFIRPELRLLRAGSLARAGRVAEVAGEADAFIRFRGVIDDSLIDAADSFAQLAGATKDPNQADAFAVRAVACLRDAAAKGRVTARQIAADKDLDPLRSRDEFKKLVAELEGKK
jgi:serine/threonine-protein kinase